MRPRKSARRESFFRALTSAVSIGAPQSPGLRDHRDRLAGARCANLVGLLYGQCAPKSHGAQIGVLEQQVNQPLFPPRSLEDVRLEHAVNVISERLALTAGLPAEYEIGADVEAMTVHHIALANQAGGVAVHPGRVIEESGLDPLEFPHALDRILRPAGAGRAQHRGESRPAHLLVQRHDARPEPPALKRLERLGKVQMPQKRNFTPTCATSSSYPSSG
jgi:hypothetical protein